MKRTFFVTLNWNTFALFEKLFESVEDNTVVEHTWVIVDNGSVASDYHSLLHYCAERFKGAFGMFVADKTGWGRPGIGKMDCVVVRSNENLGCVLGHNLAFDMCAAIAGDNAYDIVMFDTDVEVHHAGWLHEIYEWLSNNPSDVGIVGLEHNQYEKCAGAVFLDTQGYWYLHGGQTDTPVPVRGESVGLGMALLRWPVPQLRFDEGFVLYYKQDDDLCFQCRANFGLDVWAYPIQMVHWGSGALRENEYHVNDATNTHDKFEAVKRQNQKYFSSKWAWALRGRRPTLDMEAGHLREMAALMRERRLDSGMLR